MVGRPKLAFSLLLTALVMAPTALQAQVGGRYRVLVPQFEMREDADDDFGKDAAKELRKLLEQSQTHQAIEEGDIKDDLKRFKMKMEELDCIRTRQLASQMNAQVALCANYVETGDKTVRLEASFWDIASSEEFAIDARQFNEDDKQQAAQYLFDAFDGYVQQLRAVGICQQYFASQQFENALGQCDKALEMNPGAIETKYLRARIYYEMDDYDRAFPELEEVLEVNAYHEQALQLAGYIAATEGMDDKAREYYGRYLEVNPDNVNVRMKVAYDLATAGDPQGGMQIIQVGLDADPTNVDMLEQYGGFAFAAALELVQEASMGMQDGASTVPPGAVELYREAIDAYTRVFEEKGAETPVTHLRNILNAYIQLDEPARAAEFGERILETHSQEDALWSSYADALQRAGRLDDAIAALDRVQEINPSHPSAALRQGQWLIQANQVARAVEVLSAAAANDPQRAQQAANMVFSYAYNEGFQKGNFDLAIRTIQEAKKLPNLAPEMNNQLNFWHGYNIYQGAIKAQEPQTPATAAATLPRFREALRLFGNVGNYPATVKVNVQQLIDGANTYIEIQEAIIKRGK